MHACSLTITRQNESRPRPSQDFIANLTGPPLLSGHSKLPMLKVLVADDDAVERKLLEALLTGWSYAVLASVDGEEALAQLTAHEPPSLAILDYIMPKLNGVEVCRRVREKMGQQ